MNKVYLCNYINNIINLNFKSARIKIIRINASNILNPIIVKNKKSSADNIIYRVRDMIYSIDVDELYDCEVIINGDSYAIYGTENICDFKISIPINENIKMEVVDKTKIFNFIDSNINEILNRKVNFKIYGLADKTIDDCINDIQDVVYITKENEYMINGCNLYSEAIQFTETTSNEKLRNILRRIVKSYKYIYLIKIDVVDYPLDIHYIFEA